MALSITGNVIEDENLGLTSLASDSDATNPDTNVVLSTFQSSIPTSSTLGGELKTLGVYPDIATSSTNGTTQAIGISENAIVSASGISNLQFAAKGGGLLNGVDTGFKAIDGTEILLYSDTSNPDIVLGREGSSTGPVAFALLMQPTSTGATVWVVQYEALSHTQPLLDEDSNTLDLNQLVYVSGTSTTLSSFNIGTKQPGQNYWLPFTSTDGASTVIVTGLDATASNPDTVNTSSVGDGSNSQAITPGGALRFDFVSSYTGGSTKDKTFVTDGTLNSLAYIEGTGGSFDISQVTPTGRSVDVKVIAQNETDTTFDSTVTATTPTVPLGDIQVYDASGNLVADSANIAGNHGITFGGSTSAPDGTINGLIAGEKVVFTSLSGALFDQFVVQNAMPPGNTPGFDILNVTETKSTTTTTAQEAGSHIIFEDSVPTASSATVSKSVDEDGLTTNLLGDTGSATATGSVTTLFNPGVDLPLTYQLSTDTAGLTSQNLSSLGTPLSYGVSSDHTTLTATAGSGGPTVFTLTMGATGAWTFTLAAPVDQPPGANDSSTTAIDLSSIVQAIDADGSMAGAAAKAFAITVIDDVPANFTPVPIATTDNIPDAANSTSTKPLTGGTGDPNASLSITDHSGADGFGALSFTGTDGSHLQGQLAGGTIGDLTTATGATIYVFGYGTGTLTATTDSTGQGLPGGASGNPITGDEVFTIVTDPTTSMYTFTLKQPIGNGSRTLFADFADVPAGNYAWFPLKWDPKANEPVTPGQSVVFTGKSAGVDTVNPSSIGVGSDKQAIAPGNAVRIDFVNDIAARATGTTVSSYLGNLSDLSYDGHYTVNNSGFAVVQINGGSKNVDIRLDAFQIADASATGDSLPTADTGQQAVTEVKIVKEDSSGNITDTLADFTSSQTGVTVTDGSTSYKVSATFGPTGDSSGVDLQGMIPVAGEYILVSTANGFNRLLATDIGNVYSNKDSFDMGGVSVANFQAGSTVNMGFDLALQDYDAFNSGLNGSLTEAGTGTLSINLTAPQHA